MTTSEFYEYVTNENFLKRDVIALNKQSFLHVAVPGK